MFQKNSIKSKAYKMLYNLKNTAVKDSKSTTMSNYAALNSSKAPLKSSKTQDNRSKTPGLPIGKGVTKGNFMSLKSRRMIDSMTFNLVLDAVSKVI